MHQADYTEIKNIVAREDKAAIQGFAAARKGYLWDSNPYNSKYTLYEKMAWDSGYVCWHQRILPWVLEKEYHNKGDLRKGQEVADKFRATGELPSELEKKLKVR